MKKFCGEITYYKDGVGGVHSDICHCCGSREESVRELTEEEKQVFLDCLREWLDNSNGTGYFWVGDFNQIIGNGGD